MCKLKKKIQSRDLKHGPYNCFVKLCQTKTLLDWSPLDIVLKYSTGTSRNLWREPIQDIMQYVLAFLALVTKVEIT